MASGLPLRKDEVVASRGVVAANHPLASTVGVLLEHSGEEELLVEVASGCVRVGAEEHLRERLCFDTLSAGQALRATLSGCPYSRFFTP